jgi:hypothetical protein
MALRRTGLFKRVLLVGLIGGAAWAVLAWPRLNDVATGATADYPDLTQREYAASPDKVAGAAEAAIHRLPGWTLIGSGHGVGGGSLQAAHVARLLSLREEISVKIMRQGGATHVNVRSRSGWFRWDFGQNARNIRAFLAALDRQLFL